MLKLYNTLTKQVGPFVPIQPSKVGLYTCGPTVYDFAHVGNLRTYIFEDLLRRVLRCNGLEVTHGMNITDVGHLVGDADFAEDKMDIGAAREGKHPLEIAKYYEEIFFNDLRELNILPAHTILRATETIDEQIAIIKELEAKGFIYQDDSAIYFDTSKLSDYGKLSGQNLADKKTGARKEVVVDTNKKNPQDFVLWFFLTGKYKDHILRWPSPWGEGFPGWHIECSAISRKILGQPFDIHTGGVDHIGTHHTNEIAQSEAAFGEPLANTWMHGEFLLIDSKRMGKSEGNFTTLASLKDKGYNPLSYRYLCLTAHYRTQLNFTDENLKAAQTAFNRLSDFMRSVTTVTPATEVSNAYIERFMEAISDDLNIPKALGVIWEMIGDEAISMENKKAALLKFDEVLGLGLNAVAKIEAPGNVQTLLDARSEARKAKDFAKSDELRDQIDSLGFIVKDTSEGQQLQKK